MAILDQVKVGTTTYDIKDKNYGSTSISSIGDGTLTGAISHINSKSGKGGHVIQNSSGTAMTQRDNMQFSGMTVTDDSTNNKTVVTQRGKANYYGTCTTAAATQTKAATVSNDFVLETGVTVAIKFTNTNTYSATASAPCKLNVNSTGAKNIYFAASSAPTGTNTTPFGRAGYINTYVYDGTYWVWTGSSNDNNTTYSAMPVSEGQTGTATTQRTMRADYLKQISEYHAKSVATEITYTQYQALTEAQKNDGTIYYITDYPATPYVVNADDVVFDNSGTDLLSTNAEDVIKEVYSGIPKFEQRTVSVNYTCAGNSQFNKNLKTVIDNDMPDGYKFLSISGFTTNNWQILPVSVRYFNNEYSLQIANKSSSSISSYVQVYYVCYTPYTEVVDIHYG